jgi:hypothetical protein
MTPHPSTPQIVSLKYFTTAHLIKLHVRGEYWYCGMTSCSLVSGYHCFGVRYCWPLQDCSVTIIKCNVRIEAVLKRLVTGFLPWGPGFNPGLFMCGWWWKRCHWNRFYSEFLPFPLVNYPTTAAYLSPFPLNCAVTPIHSFIYIHVWLCSHFVGPWPLFQFLDPIHSR